MFHVSVCDKKMTHCRSVTRQNWSWKLKLKEKVTLLQRYKPLLRWWLVDSDGNFGVCRYSGTSHRCNNRGRGLLQNHGLGSNEDLKFLVFFPSKIFLNSTLQKLKKFIKNQAKEKMKMLNTHKGRKLKRWTKKKSLGKSNLGLRKVKNSQKYISQFNQIRESSVIYFNIYIYNKIK